jgi:hypothetical protein
LYCNYLAKLQGGFIRLANSNMELTSSLLSEQHVKKLLAKKVSQLQEMQAELKGKGKLKSQEVQTLQEQGDH